MLDVCPVLWHCHLPDDQAVACDAATDEQACEYKGAVRTTPSREKALSPTKPAA
jgi:hypothetical protein